MGGRNDDAMPGFPSVEVSGITLTKTRNEDADAWAFFEQHCASEGMAIREAGSGTIAAAMNAYAALSHRQPAQAAGGAQSLIDDLEQARDLIQEVKGAEGPNGGNITDHLDFAEHWIGKVQTALAHHHATAREDRDAIRAEAFREAAAAVDRRRAQISVNSTWSRGAIYGLEQALDAILALAPLSPEASGDVDDSPRDTGKGKASGGGK